MKRKRKKAVIDPKKFRKHSDVVAESSNRVIVPGEQKLTKTGYRIPGTVCKNYETYMEVVRAGQITDRYVHPTKYKTVRVLNGHGIVNLYKDDKKRTTMLHIGDEFTLSPEIEYEFSTVPKVDFEFIVTQAHKYDSSLKVTKESSTADFLEQEKTRKVSKTEALQNNLNMVIKPRRKK